MTESNIIIYQTEDGKTRIETRLEDETVWLTIDQMAELFQKSGSTINEHILNSSFLLTVLVAFRNLSKSAGNPKSSILIAALSTLNKINFSIARTPSDLMVGVLKS